MKARYRYRVYPKPAQISALNQLFGCVRVVWNDALNFCNQSYRDGVKYPGESELQKQFITNAKKTEHRQWLSQVSNIPLQQSIRDLGTAYSNFFKSCTGKRKGKKVKPPKFKKRSNAQACRFRVGGFKVNERTVYLAKIGKLKIEWSRLLPADPSSVTIIRDAANRYFMSFVVEIDPVQLPDNGKSIGIDLGIVDFATFDSGEKIKSPKPLKAKLRRLKRAQRNLKQKIKGSNRLKLARLRIAKIHAKIKDIRTDFLHKLSTRIVNENQVIALEDLNVSGMIKNRKLSRAISDLGWRSFRTMLEAKSAMYGRDLRVISRWEPTSQKCSCCGEKGGKKELKIREWTCLFCGAIHDRDVNASRNIIQVAGGQSETQTGRGGDVRLSSKIAISEEASTCPNLDRLRSED
jgi:putative transposase